jgi:hypothetical protein
MTFDELGAFREDVKRLSRHYDSIDEDLTTIKKILSTRPHSKSPVSYELDTPESEGTAIIVCKMASRSLKGAGILSGLNLVYAWFRKEERILLVGLFHESEDERKSSIVSRKFAAPSNQGHH